MTAASSRALWDRLAAADPYRYVESHFDGDIDAFYAEGERRTQLLIDPILKKYNIGCYHLEFDEHDLLVPTALDIGCGVGRFTYPLAARFVMACGCDISPEMTRLAWTHSRPYGTRVRFDTTDGRALIYPGQSVHFAFSYSCFQHMPDRATQQANIAEIARVLTPTGIGMIHIRTSNAERAPTLHRVARKAPTWLVRLGKRLAGRDPLTADPSWIGAEPISPTEMHWMCNQAGLGILEFRPDPTHGAGSRLFAIVRRMVA